MKTKKILVPFDLKKPDKTQIGFLYPHIDSEQTSSFLEISKDKEWEVGMVVFVGKEITKNDVFAKIVDSGKKINSVKDLLENLEIYLNQITSFKIGDIVGIKSDENGFELIKIKKPKRLK
jgi:fructose-1-phosphate kinase PfkB-like protein